jgi:hypothetical protein
MTIKEIKSVIEDNSFSSNILFHGGMFVAFGDPPSDDFVVIGHTKTVKDSSIYKDGNKTNSGEDSCSELFKHTFDLCDASPICFFTLAEYQVKFIQKTITSFNATHLLFYSDGEGIWVNFYDVRKSVPHGRMNRSHETRLLVHKLSGLKRNEFKITLNAWSFQRIPSLEFDVRIGSNKICVLTHEESGHMYLLRDQELVQPVINFFSDRLGQEISFCFPARSNFPVPETNQMLTPDFE